MPARLRSPTLVLLAGLVLAADSGDHPLTSWLGQPIVAFVLLALGVTSVMVEIANPGIIGTGVGGVTAILAGLWSLSMQPTNPLGLLLIVVAATLFAVEVLTASPGVAGAIGAVSLLVGGLILIDDPVGGGVPPAIVGPTSVAIGAAVIFTGRLARRVRQRPSITGDELFVGRDVVIDHAAGATGQAFVEGAWWQLRSTDAPLRAGDTVRVVAVDHLVLIVDPHPPTPQPKEAP
jgi:membrane-bound serine protease (ClpP class)